MLLSAQMKRQLKKKNHTALLSENRLLSFCEEISMPDVSFILKNYFTI